MNVNIIEHQVLQEELEQLKGKIHDLENHIHELEEMSHKYGVEIHKCPFCESEVQIIMLDRKFAIFCSNSDCYMYGGFGHRAYPTISDAIEQWNGAFDKKLDEVLPAKTCPICGTSARTIAVSVLGVPYYRTMCGNRRCILEDFPEVKLHNKKNSSIKEWNDYIETLDI